jgi:hypothetical protein
MQPFEHGPIEGLICQQHKDFQHPFRTFFNLVKPTTVVEIGIGQGATSLALNRILKEVGHEYEMISYELHPQGWYSMLSNEGIKVRICNLFTDDYQNIRESNRDEIVGNLQREGTTVLLCDGGLKKMEVNLLTDYLKPGDFVMAHDYVRNVEYFEEAINKRIWNWCEITDADIQETIDRNQLEDFMRDEFQNVAWMCRRKPS